MGNIISEGSEYIGHIDNNGYVYDKRGARIAVIYDNGSIVSEGGERLGIIMPNGTICDSMSNRIGQILENGYVYIHSKRVCQVSSSFIERLTPDAYNYGEPGTRKTHQEAKAKAAASYAEPSEKSLFSFGFYVKLAVGIAISIGVISDSWDSLGLLGSLLTLIICPSLVFVFCFIAKIFFLSDND